jgi:hypothetical protein
VEISMAQTRLLRTLGVSISLLLVSVSFLRAADSADVRLGGGRYTSLLGLAYAGDLTSSDNLGLEANIDFNTITHTARPDESSDLGMKLDWMGQNAWSGDVGLDGSTDTRDATSEGGFSFSCTYLIGRRAHGDIPDSQFMAFTFGAGFHTYKVDVGDDTVLAFTQSGKSLDIDAKGDLNLSQFAPTFGLDVPFDSGHVVPSISYTLDTYSANPNVVANIVEQQVLLGPDAGRVYSLVAQFYREAWNFGLSVDLPWDLNLNGTWNHAKLVTDDTWQDMPSITLTEQFSEAWSGHLAWSSIVVEEISTPQWEIGAGYSW